MLTCCPGLTAISGLGITYTIGASRGYDKGIQDATGMLKVEPLKGTGNVPFKHNNSADEPFEEAVLVQ